MKALSLAVLALTIGSAAHAQKFEVASIKPNAANDNRVMIRMAPGGRFTATGVPLKMLIAQAYGVRPFQISGGPGWIETDGWDVNAKMEDGAPDRVPPEQVQALLRNLLEERFGLKVRRESKESSGYALVQGKNGPKLKQVEATARAGAAGPPGAARIRMGRGLIQAEGMSMQLLAQQLSNQLGRPVVDKTGLAGAYEVELKFAPEPGAMAGFGPPPPPEAMQQADSGGPTLFAAIQEQLGLKLESTKAELPMIVIEAASKPTEN